MFFVDPNQLPWDGKLNYDYQLLIGPQDMYSNTEKFYQLY